MALRSVSAPSLADPFLKISSPDLHKKIINFLDDQSLSYAILVSKSWRSTTEKGVESIKKSYCLACQDVGHSYQLTYILFKNNLRLLTLPKICLEGNTIADCIDGLDRQGISSPVVQFSFNKEQPGVLFSVEDRINKTWGVIVILTYFNIEFSNCAPWHEMIVSSNLIKKLSSSIIFSTIFPGTANPDYGCLNSLLKGTNSDFALAEPSKK